jgi:uncharacterized C2H2 Zn-finger protein
MDEYNMKGENKMGFKCPVCHKDFNTNKNSWKKHVSTAHGKIVKGLIEKIAKPINNK